MFTHLYEIYWRESHYIEFAVYNLQQQKFTQMHRQTGS